MIKAWGSDHSYFNEQINERDELLDGTATSSLLRYLQYSVQLLVGYVQSYADVVAIDVCSVAAFYDAIAGLNRHSCQVSVELIAVNGRVKYSLTAR